MLLMMKCGIPSQSIVTNDQYWLPDLSNIFLNRIGTAFFLYKSAQETSNPDEKLLLLMESYKVISIDLYLANPLTALSVCMGCEDVTTTKPFIQYHFPRLFPSLGCILMNIDVLL